MDHQDATFHPGTTVLDMAWKQGLFGYLYRNYNQGNGVSLADLYEHIRLDDAFQDATDYRVHSPTDLYRFMDDLFWAEELRHGPETLDVSYRIPLTDLRFHALYRQHMRHNEDAREKYVIPDTVTDRPATTLLRNAGHDAVLVAELPPRELAQIAAYEEDPSYIIVPNTYTGDDREALVTALTEYGAEDTALLQHTDDLEANGLDAYTELPRDWEDVSGVGEQTAAYLEDSGLEPWNIDRQKLNRELVKAYDVKTQRSLSTKIHQANTHLFDEEHYVTNPR